MFAHVRNKNVIMSKCYNVTIEGVKVGQSYSKAYCTTCRRQKPAYFLNVFITLQKPKNLKKSFLQNVFYPKLYEHVKTHRTDLGACGQTHVGGADVRAWANTHKWVTQHHHTRTTTHRTDDEDDLACDNEVASIFNVAINEKSNEESNLESR
jgi:hypothetical protein